MPNSLLTSSYAGRRTYGNVKATAHSKPIRHLYLASSNRALPSKLSLRNIDKLARNSLNFRYPPQHLWVQNRFSVLQSRICRLSNGFIVARTGPMLIRQQMRFYSTTSSQATVEDNTAPANEIQKETAANTAGDVSGSVPIASIGELYKTLVFTCTVCDTRAARSFSARAYYEGVVIIKCPGCQRNHLIADNLGWFRNERVNIETLAEETGQEIKHLKAEDLLDIPPDVKEKILEAQRLRQQFLAKRAENLKANIGAEHPSPTGTDE